MAVHSGYLISKIFTEAGLPDGVIQFLPTLDAPAMCKTVFAHPEFASLHFTGSTKVFKELWKEIGNNIHTYKSYPRIVGETGEFTNAWGRESLLKHGIRWQEFPSSTQVSRCSHGSH